MENTVLITDAQSRQALAATRSLGRAGIRVINCDCERVTVAGCSWHSRVSVVLPSPLGHEGQFVSVLEEVVQRERPRMIIPMTDRSLTAIARNRSRFHSVILPFSDIETIMMARDKAKTIILAREMGIPIPRTQIIRSPADFSAVESFPVLLKPAQGSGSRGIRTVRSMGELERIGVQMLDRFGAFLAQEIIARDGPEIGCYVLYDEGSKPVAHMLQQRLRSFPARGGPGTLRVTLHDEELLERSLTLLTAMHWKGPAMVEWKDGRLMEVNPRFWGSLEGSIVAGVDFPLLLWQTFIHTTRTASVSYKDGIVTRWLFPGDVLWLVTSGFKLSHIKAFLLAFRFHDDVWSWKDPLPFFASFLIAILHLFQKEKRQFFLRR